MSTQYAERTRRGMRSIPLEQASDMALVELVRSNITEAYAELWRRHSNAVVTACKYFTGFDADDIAQETFMKVFEQLQAGRGPNTAFRAYAIMTARNTAANMARSRQSDELSGQDDSVFEEAGASMPDVGGTVLRDSFTKQVFSTLPTRWQEVLWYRDVEDLPVQEFCHYLGLSENAASALVKRAREGFKQVWIAANLEPQAELSADCQWVVERLPKMTRGKLSASAHRKLSAHFETCVRCMILADESEHIHSKLALVLLPAMIGGPAATGYTAWLQMGAPAHASAGAFEGSEALAMLDSSKSSAVLSSGISKTVALPVATIAAGALVTAIVLSSQSSQVPLLEPVPDQPTSTQVEQAGQGTQAPADEAGDDAEADAGAEAEAEAVGSDTTDAAPESLPAESPAETPAAGEGDSGSVPVVTAPDAVAPAPQPLSATPVDGIERGVFPRLSGVGAPNAQINLTVRNDQGQITEQSVTADAQGRWGYTQTKLMGVVTVSGIQSYSYQGTGVTDAETVIGTYQIGRGLGIDVAVTGSQETTIRVTGLDGQTKNQVVNVESTGLGTLASRMAATGPGEVVLVIPRARIDLGDLHYWQGDTSEGPRRVWWRIAGD